MKLIGLVVTRRHLTYDYTPIEAAHSLAPVCDTVIVSDMESDDGSYEDLQKKLGGSNNIIVETQPWDKRDNNPQWWVEALNLAREKFVAKNEMFLQLDADEVIGPESHKSIREALNNRMGAAMFRRHTFWGDTRFLVPHNKCCGEMVARLGPGHMYLPSDEPVPAVRPNIRDVAETYPDLNIYHYGMIRDNEAFLRKSEAVQNKFFGSVDPRLLSAKGDPRKFHHIMDYFGEPLRNFNGRHPAVMHDWLQARGYPVK